MPGFDRPSLSLAHSGADSTTEYTELYPDPLGEFMPEERPIGEAKRLILIEPAVPMSVEDAWRGPFTSPRESRGRWFIGWIMLGVGLVAGFAAGMAVLWNSFSAPVTPASPLNVPHVERGNSDVPVGPSLPPLEGSADGQSAAPVSELSREERPSSTTADTSAAVTGASREPAVASPVAQIAGPGLFVQSLPSGAAVYLDGQLVSTTPFQLSDIAPGTYTIRIAQPGYKQWSGSALVESGKRTRISASLELE
jgi:hypothetical protein